MLFNEYLAFAIGIGWLVAAALAAVVPSLPGGFGRRHAGWLFAFCVTRILAESVALTAVETGAAAGLADQTWRPLAALISGMVLWEFARRLWNDRGPRHIPAATHLVAAECAALVIAVTLALDDAARPEWFAPIALAAALLPGLLGFASTLLLWRALDRETAAPRPAALRTAVFGLGTFALFGDIPGVPAGAALPPWLTVTGLGLACLALQAARTRFTLLCALGLFLAVVAGPVATRLHVENEAEAQAGRLRRQATAAAAKLQGAPAAALETVSPDPAVARLVRSHLQRLRDADVLLRDAAIWQPRGDRIQVLAGGADSRAAFGETRAATAAEKAGFTRARSFVLPADLTGADDGLAAVLVPLRATPFDSPAAWLRLEYPGALWALQRQHARRAGLALSGALAAFCAIGFVLALRQTLENAQHLAVERAQSADKAKTEFLAFLSHEMRTPLQTILGRTELLRRESPATAAAHRHTAAIETQGRHLLRLVSDLLDLGTVEAGRLRLHPAPFSLRALVASLEEAHGPVAAAKGLALVLELDPALPDALVGDEARLRQILGNLLHNAVKFTPAGTVTFRITPDTGRSVSDSQLPTLGSPLLARLAFEVADTGPGLPPDKIARLFTLFTRLDSGATFSREGTGVGLALVRRLCELMDGTAAAANAPGGGAVFTVRLAFPLAPAASATAPAPVAAAPAGGLLVLVAEDNAPAREFLVEALAALGHRAVAAADGPSALAAAAEARFDAAILDLNLPGLDGIGVARALAALPHRPRLVACSAELLPAARAAAHAAGIDTYLEKPVALAALAAALGPGDPADPGSAASIFERLRAPALAARTRATLRTDFTALVAELRSAHAAGDPAAVARLAHRLRSSALLAADPALADLGRGLEVAADRGEPDAIAAALAAVATRGPPPD